LDGQLAVDKFLEIKTKLAEGEPYHQEVLKLLCEISELLEKMVNNAVITPVVEDVILEPPKPAKKRGRPKKGIKKHG